MKIIDKPTTTGIGSLPHHNSDAALAYSLKMGIPFLPQIPIRNPWEFMIAQALDGLPGLQVDPEGETSLNLDIWNNQSHRLGNRLQTAFDRATQEKDAFQAFEPSASTSSCWQPFLWELQERGIKLAKIQIAGPLTSQWALKLKGSNEPQVDKYPELGTQIFRLVLAKSLAMIRRLLAEEIQPILYLDEPGLFALSLNQSHHLLYLQELKLMIQTLRKEGAFVGLHCCSNTDWKAIFNLGIDILSLDTDLSLGPALSIDNGKGLEAFIRSGSLLSLGIIPTTRSAVLQALDPKERVAELLETFRKAWGSQPELIQQALNRAIYTPACGLALQSTSDSELILAKLMETYEQIIPYSSF